MTTKERLIKSLFEFAEEQVYSESNSQKNEVLSIAINSLPTIEKQVIHLFYLEELRISEISIVLDIATGLFCFV